MVRVAKRIQCGVAIPVRDCPLVDAGGLNFATLCLPANVWPKLENGVTVHTSSASGLAMCLTAEVNEKFWPKSSIILGIMRDWFSWRPTREIPFGR